MKKRLKLWVKITLVILIIIVLTLIYGFFINSHGFKVKEIALYENIKDSYNGFKIVHMSDLYYGNNIKKKELKKIIEKINLIKPDIVVFTGDLLYKNNKESTDDLIQLLSKIDCNIGKYYISGNEDYNNDSTYQILDNSGFINLNDTYNLIYRDKTPILIAGLSTSKNKTDISEKLNSTLNYLSSNNVYSILIMHEPNLIDEFDYSKFNLILAGHNQGGIIKLPIIGGIILPKNNYLYGLDHYKKKDTNIYISNGLGNSNVNFRLFNKPSFNFYRLRKK